MDSSPDLSLKLRRGSSDSRDNFYMDFAQGIDSDIEEVDNSVIARAPQEPPTNEEQADIEAEDDELAALAAAIPPPVLPTIPMGIQPPPPLPTLSEHDDLPPTPPPHQSDTAVSSGQGSPTTSVLEMIPPPLPPLPSNLSYVHGNGAHGSMPEAPETPPMTKSPSTSPSPPETPPPMEDAPISPPPTPISPPVSSPPSKRSQVAAISPPVSPPPLPIHRKLSTTLTHSASPEFVAGDMLPTSPPPEFGEAHDMVAAVLAAAVESTALEMEQARYQVAEENKSYNEEDESTTITTPPSNGYSGSSIIAPPAEQFGDMEDDVGLQLADIPPPAGLEDDEPDDENPEEEDSEEKTPTSVEQPQEEALTEEHTTADTPADEIVEHTRTPTPQHTPTGSVSSKRSISGQHTGSRGPSRSASRSGSRKSSRSSSIRGSVASRAGSIAAGSVTSAAPSVVSGSQQQIAGISSPQASIKSIRSQASVKSPPLSQRGSIKSPPPMARMQSPPEGDSPPAMPSPPPMKRDSPLTRSPPQMHSPPLVTSPPRVYSPPLISSPPMQKVDLNAIESEKTDEEPADKAGTGTDSIPTSSTEADPLPIKETSKVLPAAIAISAPLPATSISFQDEQQHVVRPHLSSHHHYHLPHQFQHPHHQNHHTHSMPVATPTAPPAYTSSRMLHESRHIRTASGSGPDDDGNGAPVPSPNLLVSSETTSHVSTVSPAKSSTRLRDSTSQHRVTIDDSTLPQRQIDVEGGGGGGGGSGGSGPPSPCSSTQQQLANLGGTERQTGHLALMYHSHQLTNYPVLPAIKRTHRPSFMYPPMPRVRAGDALATLFSALYGKLLVVMGVAFPMAEVISTYIPPSFYEGGPRTVELVYKNLTILKPSKCKAFSSMPTGVLCAGDDMDKGTDGGDSGGPFLCEGKLTGITSYGYYSANSPDFYTDIFYFRNWIMNNVYYLYLYIGSMLFLFFMYATLLWGRPKLPVNIASPTKSAKKARSSTASDSMDESDTDSTSTRNKPPVIPMARRPSLLAPLGRQHHYGSFYLRMGAVAFGIGSMIYSGLEFGQYFELNPDTKCHNVLLALTPATRMAFIFIQMYFIFLNNEQIKVYRYKIIARFGLMHMIGTNLAVWLNVLIQETKHEILTFYNPENRTLRISHRLPMHSRGHAVIAATDHTAHLRVPRGLKGPHHIFECRRTNILGTLVQDASPFLFPCTIEYSLICAAILYVMWQSISRPQTPQQQRPDTISSPMKRSPHHYSVDCARAHKGLFVGILILVLTIISLILFFVLIQRPDFVALAVTEVTICELLIYATATLATLIGMFQIRHLQYDAFRSFSLDDILLVGAQTGSFLYNIFTVIAGQFSLRSDDMLVPLNALASIVQTACQTMFILDASRRQAVSPEHLRKKPAREIVTFMLVVNLAMWAISTLEKSRAESHPIQLNFYGLWAWTIITHVSMPLAIFYRFHSTVCLCEIWKRAYKLKPAYM